MKQIVRPWPALMTIEVVADYSGVSRRTVELWIEEGKLDPHELPGINGREKLDKTVIEKTKLDRFLRIRGE